MMREKGEPGSLKSWRSHLLWMKPGLGVKRWLLLLAFGITLFSLGGASLLRAFYPLPSYFYYLTLQFIPRTLRVFIFFLTGVGSIAMGLWGLNRSLLEPFLKNISTPYPDILYEYRRRGRGPRIVVLGGGHGQATILRGLKPFTANLTAIVTVADDGGSSGRLRRELGILPPGDFRNCIAALSNDESLVTRLFHYRFSSNAGLDGHSFGNLYISAMAGVTGSFESALEQSSHVLAVQGRVLPSTLETVVLAADVQLEPGQPPVRVFGESQIPQAGGHIVRTLLEPSNPKAYPGAVKAILNADMIVIGPGSLYTSLMPNLLVPEIAEALRATRAPKVYICNITTQAGETETFTAEHHLSALERHLGPGLFSAVILNLPPEEIAPPEGTAWVMPELASRPGLRLVTELLADSVHPWQHNSEKLGRTVMRLLK